MTAVCEQARIEQLRARAVDPHVSYQELVLHFYRRYEETSGPRELRFADAYGYALDHADVCVDPDELIVGKPAHRLTEAEQAEYEALRDGPAKAYTVLEGQSDHMAVDYELLLREGAAGVMQRIDGYLADCTEESKRLFYESCKLCLQAMVRFSRRHAQELRRLAEDAGNRSELLALAEICDHVPEFPARTFHEAVQSVHFLSFCLGFNPYRREWMSQFQLGRPDRYLYPYYQADQAAGTLTDDRAQTLFDCLAIQINRRVPHGLSCGYMLGGRDRQGRLVANELTMMGMQVIDDIRLVYPSVGLCWNTDMPDEYLAKACEILSHGRSHPAIFNDDLITQGLMEYGVEPDRAHDYIHSTCVEITPCAASHAFVASPYHNMLKFLLDRMDREYDSFDELMQVIYADLDAATLRGLEEQNANRRIRREKGMWPLLSCFVDDCLARGLDMDRGGAKYNWIMPSYVGMANLVDSLHVVRKKVFEEKSMTIADLRRAMDANFEGMEPLRLQLMNGVAKYGNDEDEVDSLFTEIVDHIVAECRRHTPELPNARLIPSVFCWIMHEQFGRETGASPDGRLAGFPLGDGSGPCQGREMHGPTASILSSTKWSHKELIGGVAVNMKFTRKTFTADSTRKVQALVKTFMLRGGFEIQINVVDRETLLRALEEPDNYRDLVVRIGGYSDYFVRIPPQMQQEVLLRTSHDI